MNRSLHYLLGGSGRQVRVDERHAVVGEVEGHEAGVLAADGGQQPADLGLGEPRVLLTITPQLRPVTS